jgi:hypothetical protein
VKAAGETFVLEFTRDATKTDGVIALDAVTSLTGGAWTSIAESDAGAAMIALDPEVQVEEEAGGSGSPTTVRVTVPKGSTPKFFRIRVVTETP